MKSVRSTRQFGEKNSNNHRLSLVAGACALALGASLAHAQTSYTTATTPYNSTGPVNATASQTLLNDDYMIWVTNPQFNSGSSASTVNNTAAALVPAQITLTGDGTGATPSSVVNNSASAVAAGNQNTTSVALEGITSSGGKDGIGTLAAQVQLNGSSSAEVKGAVINVTESAMLAAAATITGNSLTASTTINRSDTTVSGVLPVDYNTSVNGSIDLGYKPASGITDSAFTATTGRATTTASVNLNTYQTSLEASANAGSSSAVTNSQVKLDIQQTGGVAPELSAPLTVSGNTLSAQFDVNKSSNVFQASAGSGTFTGSVGVTNVQANIESAAAATSASVSGSSITSNITQRDPGATPVYTPLTGTLVQSSNTISAASTGNTSGQRNAAGTILAGNAILLTSGADLTRASGSATSNGQVSNATQVTSGTSADLAMLNLQRNDTTNLKSNVSAGEISARADNVTTGTMTLNSNSVASSAEGNLAGNLIEAIATNSNATAAAANVQANVGTPIEADNLNSTVKAGVGNTGQTVSGTVTLNQNSLSATASGNAGNTNIVMLASNLTAQTSGASPAVADVLSGQAVASAGLSATNLQSNISVTGTPNDITASLGTSTVAANFSTDGSTTLANAVPLAGATVSLNQNTLKASASGNSASTGVTLTGAAGSASNATVQAAVANSQLNDSLGGTELMTVSSTISDAGVRAFGGAVSGSSQLSVNNNTLAAAATGSSAANTLAAEVTNLTVGPNALAAGASTVTASGATSTAALGLASSQINQAAVTASNTTNPGTQSPFAGVQVGSVAASQLAVNSNQASASSTGNSVTNALQINATNIASTTGDANAIAALSSLQSNAVTGAASAEVGASAVSSTPVLGVLAGAVSGSSAITVSDNSATASALGNTGSNRISVTGSNLTSTAPTVATGLASATSAVTSEFALTSSQSDSVSLGRTADATDVVTGINAGALTSSSLTVANNLVSAEARSNQITNAASLTGFSTLTTSAGLLNVQSASTALTATVTGASTGVVSSGAISSAQISVNSNAVEGLAVGSSAGNTLAVAASVLAGNPKAGTESGVATTTSSTIAQTADFSLGNSQNQNTGLVSADVTGTQTFRDSGAVTVTGSKITVNGNTVQGMAQSLSASNVLSLSGDTSAKASAALGNVQNSSSDVTALTTATQGVVGTTLTTVGTTDLTVSGNTAKALAVGTSASNTLNANAANLSGNSQTKGTDGGASYTVGTSTALTKADFALSSVQSQSGALTSTLASTQIVDLSAAAVTGGTLTVNGNTAAAVAQANSVANSQNLTGTNLSNLTGTLLSSQNATAAVTASQSAQDGSNTFAATSTSLNGSQVTVANNNLLVSAGMNEAFNQQTVSGATLAADAARGSDVTSYALASATSLTSATTSAAFSVQNVQQGNAAVTATAEPEVIGIDPGAASNGSNLTVSGNTVTAKANVNYASNALNLVASNTLAGTGSVSNMQTTGAAVTSATIGSSASPTTVGIAPPVPATSISDSSVTVSDNNLTAQAGGNTAVNALNASASSSISNGGQTTSTSSTTGSASGTNTATFAVLNYQGNASALNATVQNASIGVGATPLLANSTALVQNNVVVASGYGNTASNSLGMSALIGSSNAASAGISNVQYNMGNVSATVSGVNNGITGSAGVTGGSATVSGNSIAAQAVGNSAVNRIVALR